MSRIEINAGSRHIVVEHDGGDLAYVIDKAEALWKATEAAEPPPGPAYGFQADRRWTADTAPGNGSYFRPATAGPSGAAP